MKYLFIKKINKKTIFSLLFLLSLLPIFKVEAVGINSSLPNFGGDSLKAGLVGYWTFDGANMKSNVTDSSGNGNNGSMTNFAATSTVVTLGKLGQALKFDGVDDVVTIRPSSSVNDLPKLTIAFWAKPESLGVNRTNVAKADNSSGGHGWRVGSGSVTDSMFTFSVLGFVGGDLLTSSDSGIFVAGQWAHYVATWDGTNQASGVHLYKNGVELAATYIDGGTSLQSDSSRNIVLGRESGIGDDFFKGVMDDVRLYNRVLSSLEIKQIYNLGNSKFNEPLPNLGADSLKTGLIGYWTFDGANMKSNVTDSSENSASGFLNNFRATSTIVSVGRLGQALTFDGINDYVAIPVAKATGNSGTFCAWVNSNDSSVLQAVLTSAGVDDNAHELRIYLESVSGSLYPAVLSNDNNPVADWVRTTNSIPINKWSHFCITGDGSAYELYLNGAKETPVIGAGSNTGKWFSAVSGRVNYKIGLLTRSTGDVIPFSGKIDDLRVYNRVLSPFEIKQIYNLGNSKFNEPLPNLGADSLKTGLIGYWTFDGANMKSNVTDSSENSASGFLNNFRATSTIVSVGRLGQALTFDGINDYVAIPVAKATGTSGTFCAWVNSNTKTLQQAIITSAGTADLTHELRFSLNSVSGSLYPILLSNNGSATADWVRTTNSVPINSWSHICVTGNGSTYQLFLNGVKETPVIGAGSNTGKWFSAVSGRVNYKIGLLTRSTGDVIPFSGKIDDLRVYNRVLSSLEIKQIYNLGI